jgi:putative oxygen-independent coproporphyrinogen III oxidase
VYVHVPFCRKRCDYCAFATWTDRNHLWDRYAAACRTEADRLRRPEHSGGPMAPGPATSVFFGGGTPSLLPADLLTSILGAVNESISLAPGAEVTVECNPETINLGKLEAYRRAGVTRLSFGAQSMLPHVLVSLGREHDPASVRRAAQLAGESGFAGAYSVDLIFGAAGESMADWEASLEAVLGFDPPPAHVSAYALTIEPGTPLASHPERHPVDDDQAEKYLRAEAMLSDAGYAWYEISNWARPGARCSHNLLYWSQGEYMGLGCAAHSHRLRADGGARRWWNVRTPERYCRSIEDGLPTEAAGEDLQPAEREWEALMLDLRTFRGVPAEVVPDELFEQELLAPASAEGRGEAGDPLGIPASAGPSQAHSAQAHSAQAHSAQAHSAQAHSAQAHSAQAHSAQARPERAVLTPRGRLLANEVAVRLRARRALAS